MSNLVVLVSKGRVDDAIDRLEAEEIYDDSREIFENESGMIGLPITTVPDNDIGMIISDPAPEPRITGINDLLRERDWTPSEIELTPNSWAVIGDVILVRIPQEMPRSHEFGEALLELHGNTTTVFRRDGISGEHREPSVEVLVGDGETETIHTEHGIQYAMDVSEVMFSPGNKAERLRMQSVTESSDRVLDMFAGIGYFSLPIAKADASVTAIERNPVAYQYLVENTVLNEVTSRIRAIRADCNDVIQGYRNGEIELTANRIVMGYYEAFRYLDEALSVIEPGGVIHFHEAVPNELRWDRPIGHIESAADQQGYRYEILEKREVKTHGPGVSHVAIDVEVH